ncbi:hypothetical protein [Chitinophaga sp.]|uniref:hypothetical protein n=1 Tax=Chitinophaga sp. TaxID=1869181 RepID=UPI0031DE0B59
MFKQPPVTLFLFFVFVMMPFAGRAQLDSAAYKIFVRDISRAPRMSLGYLEYGQPFELTMVYTFSNGKKTVRYFPDEVLNSVSRDLSECERVLKKTKWQDIYPALKTADNFSIVIPMVFRFLNGPGMTKEEEQAVIGKLFDFTDKVDPPYQISDIVFVNFFKQIR